MTPLLSGGRENCKATKMWVTFSPHGRFFFFTLRNQFYLLGYRKKALMEWQHLRQSRGQNVQDFTEEFRKQALNLGIPLDSPKVVTKYIGSLHNYIRHSLLLFEPPTICYHRIIIF